MMNTSYATTFCFVIFLLFFSSCGIPNFDLPPVSDGNPILEGNYVSSTGKLISFSRSGIYKFYLDEQDFYDGSDPDKTSEYTVIGKSIYFKDSTGQEIPEIGNLDDTNESFTWEKYAGEIFQFRE